MQQRARSLKDAAAQSAHLASFWVSRSCAVVKAWAGAAADYAEPRLREHTDTALRFVVRTWEAAQAIVGRGLETVRDATVAVRARGAEASAYVERRTYAFRVAAAPCAVGAALSAGAAVVVAPGLLLAGAGLSVLAYHRTAPPVPVTTGRPNETLPPGVTFIERFHAINEARWEVSDGWDNGYWNWSDWRRSALHPSADGLAIIMAPNPPGASKPFAGGELQSHDLYRYGYYEVRMRVPRGDGLVAGFFSYTMPEGSASQQEIDIEFVGSRPRMIEFTYHLGRHSVGQRVHLPFDATEGFHTYAFEWTPEGIRWFVDNRLMHAVADEGARSLNLPERLYLSLSASRIAAWTGELDHSKAPWRMDVSCVAQANGYQGRSLCAP